MVNLISQISKEACADLSAWSLSFLATSFLGVSLPTLTFPPLPPVEGSTLEVVTQ